MSPLIMQVADLAFRCMSSTELVPAARSRSSGPFEVISTGNLALGLPCSWLGDDDARLVVECVRLGFWRVYKVWYSLANILYIRSRPI